MSSKQWKVLFATSFHVLLLAPAEQTQTKHLLPLIMENAQGGFVGYAKIVKHCLFCRSFINHQLFITVYTEAI